MVSSRWVMVDAFCLAGHLMCTPERLIEMYHHHHEQHNRVWYPRAPPPPANINWAWLSATYLYLTFRHACVYPRDRRWE